MKSHALALGVAAATLLAVGGCNKSNGGGNAQQSAQTPKAEKMAGSQTIASGLDKAAAMADKKTKGKYHDKIDNAASKAKDGLDKLDGKNDDIADEQPKP